MVCPLLSVFEKAGLLGLDAGVPFARQLSTGSKIMYTLTGQLEGRAALQWAARNSGSLATKIFRVGASVPMAGVMLFLE